MSLSKDSSCLKFRYKYQLKSAINTNQNDTLNNDQSYDPTNKYSFTLSQENPHSSGDVIRRYSTTDYITFYNYYLKAMAIKKKPYYNDIVNSFKDPNNKCKSHLLCINEKLSEVGRPVIDIDIDSDKSYYQQFINQYEFTNNVPTQFVNDIRIIIINALVSIGRSREADIIRRESIQWFNCGHPNWQKYSSPLCISFACRNNKFSCHITLPFVVVSTYQVNQYDTVTTQYDMQLAGSLRIAMKELYNAIDIEANRKWPFLNGDKLCDSSLLTRNHDLRLPGFTKFEHLHRPECELRIFDKRQTIMNAISCVYDYMVPDELKYILTKQQIDECNTLDLKTSSSFNEKILEDGKEKDIYDMICNYLPNIRDIIENIEYKYNTYYCILKPDTTCPVCNSKHDIKNHNHPHISNIFGSYHLTCWQWYRKNKNDVQKLKAGYGPIYLCKDYSNDDNKYDVESWKNKVYERAITANQALYHRHDKLDDTHIDTVHEQDLKSVPYDNDVYICSAMGTGKTKTINSQLTNIHKYIMYSCRTIQADKYKKEFNDAVLYKESEKWEDADKLIVEFESSSKVRTRNHEVVILDEVETLMKLINSPTILGREAQTINSLIDIITKCDRLIVLDAFLKQETVNSLIELRSDKDYRIIINTFKQIERSGNKSAHIYRLKTHWVAKIRDDKSKKVIACTSKKIADNITHMLRNLGQNTLCISSDSDKATKTSNPHDLWTKYHNIVYTPALANSISFEMEHFDTLYLYVCKGSVGPEDIIQMTCRVRSLKNNDMHVYVNNAFGNKVKEINEDEEVALSELGIMGKYLPCSYSSAKHYILDSQRYFRDLDYKLWFVESYGIMIPWVQESCVRAWVDWSLGQRHMKDILIYLMKNTMGWNVIENVEYENKASLPSCNKKENSYEKQLFDSYVKDSYTDKNKLYKNIWLKNDGKTTIENMSIILRGYDHIYNKKGNIETLKSDTLQKLLNQLFELGTSSSDKIQSFNDFIILQKPITLTFSPKDREKLDSIMIPLGALYNTVPPYRFWEWLGMFFRDKLLLDGIYKSNNMTSSYKKYCYTLNIDENNIWYHIEPEKGFLLGTHLLYKNTNRNPVT